MSETSNASTLRAPLPPARSRCHVGSTPQASGVTMPIPVTTTRLISGTRPRRFAGTNEPAEEQKSLHRQGSVAQSGTRWRDRGRPATRRAMASLALPVLRSDDDPVPDLHPRRDLTLGVLFQELHRVAHGEDRFGGIIGNLAAELLLERHHELDRIEAVRTE